MTERFARVRAVIERYRGSDYAIYRLEAEAGLPDGTLAVYFKPSMAQTRKAPPSPMALVKLARAIGGGCTARELHEAWYLDLGYRFDDEMTALEREILDAVRSLPVRRQRQLLRYMKDFPEYPDNS